MILDTNYLIQLLGKDEPAFQKGIELFEDGVPTRVSMATVFELFYGASMTLDDDDYREVRNVLMGYPPAPIDEEIARLAAEMLGKADRDAGGSMQSGIEANDAYIAATARAYAEPVLTRNVTDFERLGVAVETY